METNGTRKRDMHNLEISIDPEYEQETRIEDEIES